MRTTSQQYLRDNEILTMPLTLDPVHAKTVAQASFELTSRAKDARCSPCRAFSALASDVQTGQSTHLESTEGSDEALIEAIGRGDRHAMALLYGRHHVQVYRFALRIIGDATLAEDIVSEVFLDVWRCADAFKARARAATWLLAITRNKSISALRRGSNKELELDWETVEIPDSTDDPEILACKRDRSEIIRRCLSQLSAAHREIIDLVYYHEKSVAEVAEIVGVPSNTVKTRMFHARRRMGEFLKAAGLGGI
jgi:RNA polymerase sigma-70 factor (ECF subfamily)